MCSRIAPDTADLSVRLSVKKSHFIRNFVPLDKYKAHIQFFMVTANTLLYFVYVYVCQM